MIRRAQEKMRKRKKQQARKEPRTKRTQRKGKICRGERTKEVQILPIELEQLQAFQSKRAVVAVIKINDKETRARINTAIKRKDRIAEEKAEKEAEEEKRKKKRKSRKITGKRRPPKRRMTGKMIKRTK